MDYNNYWWSGAKEDLEEKQRNGIEANGVIMNPKFVNINKQDYRIKNKKLLKKIGFKPFDVSIESFGITKDYPRKFKKLDKTLN